MATVGLSSHPPATPKAGFAISVCFDKDAEHPQRIFRAIGGVISAFEDLDRVFAKSLDPSIEPVLVLEDVEAGSIRIWLRDKLIQTEDQSLYELDWKPMVGKYLLAAKWAFVEWVTDEEKRQSPRSLSDLRKKFMELATQTDLKKIPAYGVPSHSDLIGAAEKIGGAISQLDKGDSVEYISEPGTAKFSLTQNWEDLKLADLAVRETIESPPTPMILAVRRPDYLGEAQWEFRHGKRTIRARVEDESWLKSFQDRNVDVRPGDALCCIVRVQIKYGFDNELVAESFTIDKVDEILENQYQQADLFSD